MIKTVPEMLQDVASIFEERRILYGENYKTVGAVMQILFPTGPKLSEVQDFNRFAILSQIVTKITRYANNFEWGGHPDSLDDISVYAQILQLLDEEARLKANNS